MIHMIVEDTETGTTYDHLCRGTITVLGDLQDADNNAGLLLFGTLDVKQMAETITRSALKREAEALRMLLMRIVEKMKDPKFALKFGTMALDDARRRLMERSKDRKISEDEFEEFMRENGFTEE